MQPFNFFPVRNGTIVVRLWTVLYTLAMNSPKQPTIMKKEGKILIIDDEEDILLTLRIFLKQHYTFVKAEPNPHYIPR